MVPFLLPTRMVGIRKIQRPAQVSWLSFVLLAAPSRPEGQWFCCGGRPDHSRGAAGVSHSLPLVRVASQSTGLRFLLATPPFPRGVGGPAEGEQRPGGDVAAPELPGASRQERADRAGVSDDRDREIRSLFHQLRNKGAHALPHLGQLLASRRPDRPGVAHPAIKMAGMPPPTGRRRQTVPGAEVELAQLMTDEDACLGGEERRGLAAAFQVAGDDEIGTQPSETGAKARDLAASFGGEGAVAMARIPTGPPEQGFAVADEDQPGLRGGSRHEGVPIQTGISTRLCFDSCRRPPESRGSVESRTGRSSGFRITKARLPGILPSGVSPTPFRSQRRDHPRFSRGSLLGPLGHQRSRHDTPLEDPVKGGLCSEELL